MAIKVGATGNLALTLLFGALLAVSACKSSDIRYGDEARGMKICKQCPTRSR